MHVEPNPFKPRPGHVFSHYVFFHQKYEGTEVCLHCGLPEPWPSQFCDKRNNPDTCPVCTPRSKVDLLRRF